MLSLFHKMVSFFRKMAPVDLKTQKIICALATKKSGLFIQAYSRTTAGVYRLGGPIFTPESDKNFFIGQSVLDAFKECKMGVYHSMPYEHDPSDNLILKLAKVRSWNALMKISKCVGIGLFNNAITLTPTTFGGTSGDQKGYHNLEDKAITTTDHSPENLGRLLSEAFALSENSYIR